MLVLSANLTLRRAAAVQRICRSAEIVSSHHLSPRSILTVHFLCFHKMSGEPPAKKIKTEDVKPQANASVTSATSGADFLSRVHELRLKTAESVVKFKFNKKRVRVLSKVSEFPDDCEGVLYWMSRDQRVQDNWAFLYAQKLALKLEVPLHVCFCLVPRFLEATIRHFAFMLKGLREVQEECTRLDISFHLLTGYAKDQVPGFVRDHKIGGVVTDFSPLRVPSQWVDDVTKALPKDVPMCQVDAHNVVPCWEASPKLEYGARTIRKKIHDKLPTFFTEFPPVITHPHKAAIKPEPIDWEAAEASLEVDRTVGEVDWATPGTTGGMLMLKSFIQERLKFFAGDRNDPTKKALSNMSPWYHFGQVAPQRGMLLVRQYRSKYKDGVEGYIEEGIVRRELSDNFCFYNPKYDSLEGAYEWARKTLNDHRGDKREKNYSREQLEKGQSYDDLWNAAQMQLVHEGKMHGFLRMYWAKKILEWTDSPERALADAIYLNDRYNLDGRDPNGYVGCMWSICGIHDQGWAERPVFGKIRYMNYKGCQRKFDVKGFVAKYRGKKFPGTQAVSPAQNFFSAKTSQNKKKT